MHLIIDSLIFSQIADVLVSKTIPRKWVTVEDVDDEDSPMGTTSNSKKAHCNIVEDDSDDGENIPSSQPSLGLSAAHKPWKVCLFIMSLFRLY